MGIPFSRSVPVADIVDLDGGFEAVFVKSINFTHVLVKQTAVNLDNKVDCSEKMIVQVPPPSFNKGRELESNLSFETPTANLENLEFSCFKDPHNYARSEKGMTDIMGDVRNQAALKLQKVYKSFRTRRQLADCAVVVEQKWWKVLDFAELKRSSISFFDIEKPETAISRWSRAKSRAAKVGKGLSKDEKARKLALQHWLEAIDPRHRYGHNLQFFYAKWLHCESNQPFFYWLDVGEGREVYHERCPRSKLQQQCIKYLGPTERQVYEVTVMDGTFMYKQSGKLLDTSQGPPDAKWIFVLSTSKTLYVGQKNKGTFQHSSFLAGGATLSAGRLVVHNGILKAVWPHSGHYLPTEENFQAFMSFLDENHVDLTSVERNPEEEGEEAISRKSSNIHSALMEDTETLAETDEQKQDDNNATAEDDPSQAISRLSKRTGTQMIKLGIPEKSVLASADAVAETLPTEHADTPTDGEDGYETAEESFLSESDFMVAKKNLFDEDDSEEEESPISKDKIMQRIDSHKGMKSYQLAQHLSTKWSTGAGPRIGCMRDYPSELRFRVLEQAHFSPRARNAIPHTGSFFSPKPLSISRQGSIPSISRQGSAFARRSSLSNVPHPPSPPPNQVELS